MATNSRSVDGRRGIAAPPSAAVPGASIALAVVVALAAGVSGCRPVSRADAGADAPIAVAGRGAGAAPAAARTPRGAAAPDAPPPPGQGVVAGRLIDQATGLPVPDVQIQLVETGRRTLSGANGTFRFDGVPVGALTIALGPSETHTMLSRRATVGDAGLDLGLVPLLAADAPTYIVPDLGGVAPGCGATQLAVPAGAVDTPLALRVTCLPGEAALPAPPPAGRLPLSVVDLAPAGQVVAAPMAITVTLPAQPRYAPGVTLDLLQLDVRRLTWDVVGSATVDPGGETASGSVGTLAPTMVVAPAFGALGAAGDARPTIARYNVAAAADGTPLDAFARGTVVVFAGFDYAGMANTVVRVKTTDAAGATVFESRRPYTDAGRDDVPMLYDGGQPWPAGAYATTWSIGDPPLAVGKAVAWSIGDAPAAPTAMAVVIAPELARDGVSLDAPYGDAGLPPAAAPAGASGCARPAGWFEYTVQPGDTVSMLAARTGVAGGTLMAANCMAGDAIYAGRLLFLPRFPAKPAGWTAPAPGLGLKPGVVWPAPIATAVPGGVGRPPAWSTKAPEGPPPTLAPLPYPTTWYTPPPPAAPGEGSGALWPPSGSVGGGSVGGGAGSGAAPPGGGAAPAPYVPPPSAPTRMPPKDPSPAEPTLAPRPSP